MKKIGLVIFQLIIGFAMFNGLQAQDLETARFLGRSEQYDEAQKVFEQLIQKEPKNSKNYFFYGENYLLDYFADTISNSLVASLKAAKSQYDKGVSVNPNEPLNYIGLAKIAFYQDDDKTTDEMRKKAKSFLLPYKKLSKIKPPAQVYAFILAKLAESYIKNDNVDTSLAMPLIREAIKIDSKNRDIFLITGDIYMLLKDGSNAVKYYNRAQYCDPQSPTAKMKIGNLYMKANNLMIAIPYFEEAIKLNANYAPAYRELGQLYSSAGKYEKSKEYFKKYLELTQGNIPAKIRYVTALFYAKEYDEVVKNVAEILALDKSRTYMNRLAGYSCYEKTPPDYLRALNFMDTLFKSVSPDLIIKKDYYYLAKILLGKNQNYQELVKQKEAMTSQLDKETKNYMQAKAANKASIKLNIDTLNQKIENWKNQISIANKEIDRAFEAYDNFLSYNPNNMSVINEIASSYYRFGRFDKAAEFWSKLIGLGKDNVNDYLQVGKTYYIGENYKKADSVFTITSNKFPDNLDALIYIARTNAKMNSDIKSSVVRSKFEDVIEKAKSDSIKNSDYISEACNFLGYYHLMNNNFSTSKNYYNRIINLEASNKENKVRGYYGLGSVEIKVSGNENSIEGKLNGLSRAENAYKQILAIDPNNAAATSSLRYVQDYESMLRKGINPNELKGNVKNATGQPIQYASVRVKDTAAETYTNAKGDFKFEIPMESEALIVTAKGFKEKELPVKRPLNPIKIILEKE